MGKKYFRAVLKKTPYGNVLSKRPGESLRDLARRQREEFNRFNTEVKPMRIKLKRK